MSKGSPEAPVAPDPVATARAQTQSNIATADANRTNAVTPYGLSNWSQGPDGRWMQTSTLDPTSGRVLEGTRGLAESLLPTGGNLVGQAGGATTKPLDFSGPNADFLSKGPTALSDTAADAYYAKQKSFLDPQWGQQQTDLEDKLSRQGIPVGSDAYGRATTNFNNARTQAYDVARTGATSTGADAASKMFNMALLGQQQSIGQQQTAQQNPLKLLSMLYGGTG